jgi:hypothetical protein
MARHDLTISRRRKTAQRLPKANEEKVVSLQKHVLKLRRRHEYLLEQTGNTDQTAVLLNTPEPTALNSAGDRTVPNGPTEPINAATP